MNYAASHFILNNPDLKLNNHEINKTWQAERIMKD